MIASLQGYIGKGALMLALVGASQILPYISFLAPLYYPVMIIICIYALVFRGAQVLNFWLTVLVLVAVLGILLSNPNALFKSWQRLVSFLIVIGACGPFIRETHLYAIRKVAFMWTMFICVGVGVGSFIGYFWGINNMLAGKFGTGVGVFGGLTFHSMILGPMAGIGFCFMLWRLYVYQTMPQKNKLLTIFFLFALFASVLLAASRSSFLALLLGAFMVVYQLKKERFAKLLKSILGILVVVVLLFPVIAPFTGNLLNKQKNNIEAGGVTASRNDKWQKRLSEFKSSPLLGIGFSAMDINNTSDYDPATGVVEFGSSWLAILSTTGILGFLCMIIILGSIFWKLYHSTSKHAVLFISILVFFAIHMLAEGYIFASGSYLFFMLWLTLGASDAFLRNETEADLQDDETFET